MKKLKMYGILVTNSWRSKIGGQAQVQALIKAASKKRAVEILNTVCGRVSMHEFNNYGHETGGKLAEALLDIDCEQMWVASEDGCLRVYDSRNKPR